ncbi:MAG: WYL domain-containing protein [Clostridiales bacterium]|nr:WYL domain-containing protein [Clostridiales bacterium]
MGFLLSAKENDDELYEGAEVIEENLKQHLNLSQPAGVVVDNDIKTFYYSYEEESRSGFFNTIINNFWEIANATISLRVENKRVSLEKIFSDKNFGEYTEADKKVFIDKYLDVYKKKLVETAISYPKGSGEKFRINLDNIRILCDDIDDETANAYGRTKRGLYLKALIEEYCEKPVFEREQIFFKQVMDEILLAISEVKQLKITTKESKSFYVTPYKILQDDTKNFNYLVGLSEEIGGKKEIKVASFRISRIARIKKMSSKSGFLSKKQKDEIDAEIITKKPQFMVGDIKTIKVRFNKDGLWSFKRHVYLRPHVYKEIDKENNVYEFECTPFQAKAYFFKFASGVEILEPQDLREEFINNYKQALSVYEKE